MQAFVCPHLLTTCRPSSRSRPLQSCPVSAWGPPIIWSWRRNSGLPGLPHSSIGPFPSWRQGRETTQISSQQPRNLSPQCFRYIVPTLATEGSLSPHSTMFPTRTLEPGRELLFQGHPLAGPRCPAPVYPPPPVPSGLFFIGPVTWTGDYCSLCLGFFLSRAGLEL